MNLLKNIWFKRGISVLCLAYSFMIGGLAYLSAFYNFTYINQAMFAFIYVTINLLMLAVMIFARKQIITCVCSMLNMVLFLPLLLLEFGDWLLLIPPFLVVLTSFFASGTKEMLKTILGIIFLLIYILGSLGFFTFTNLFLTHSEETVIQQGVSPDKTLRYFVVDVQDNSGGRTEVYVEPNDKDINMGMIVFQSKGYAQRKYSERNHEIPSIEWGEDDTHLYINEKRCDLREWKRTFTLENF